MSMLSAAFLFFFMLIGFFAHLGAEPQHSIPMYDQAKLTAAVITAPHVALRAPPRRGTSKPPRIHVSNAFHLGMFHVIQFKGTSRQGISATQAYLELRLTLR